MTRINSRVLSNDHGIFKSIQQPCGDTMPPLARTSWFAGRFPWSLTACLQASASSPHRVLEAITGRAQGSNLGAAWRCHQNMGKTWKNKLKMLHGLTRCKTTNDVLGWFLTPKSSEKQICNVRTTRVWGPSSLTPKGYGSQKAVASVALVRARIPENVFGVWGFDVI